MVQAPRCAIAEWDSAFFGRRIGRLELERPVHADVAQAMAWAHEQALDCLYALVDADARDSVRALERHGFELMDVRLTLDRPVGDRDDPPSAGIEIGEPRPGDRDDLLALARHSHRGTRFTEDPRFGAGRAGELYAAWLGNALDEVDALVLVPREAGRAGGYLTLHRLREPVPHIGVLAVAPELQRRGVGRALVGEGLRRAAARGAARVSVVTQGGNASAVRFYERCGFEARRSQLWYHRWFTP
jgi:dTDP-4-amino-4,6-dideoxy-D-galactose acyltransferase